MKNTVEILQKGEIASIHIHLNSLKATKIILSVALAFCILFPMTILVAMLVVKEGSPFLLIVIPAFIYIFTRGIYKQLMWQCHGYEEFTITSNEVLYAPNIKHFKMEIQAIPSENLEILLVDRELVNDEKIGRISFRSDDYKLTSTLKVTESEYNKLLSYVRMAVINYKTPLN